MGRVGGARLVYVWESIAALIGTRDGARSGAKWSSCRRKNSWLASSWFSRFALVPLFANWKAASRAGQTRHR